MCFCKMYFYVLEGRASYLASLQNSDSFLKSNFYEGKESCLFSNYFVYLR